MENKEITLQIVLDVMNSRFEKVDKRLDAIDDRLDAIDDRLDAIDDRLDAIDDRLDAIDDRFDNMDIRITKLDSNNKNAHTQILEELQKQGNTLTKIETEFGDKISVLFDANTYTRDRMHLFGNQQLRFAGQLENFSHRLSALEKAVFAKN